MTSKRTVVASPASQTISWTREFEAPAARVFEAHTDADMLPLWTGPAGTTLHMREFDARTGGCWSYVIRAGSGDQWAFHGSFHEITAPSRLVQTFEFEGEPGHPNVEVIEFEDLPGGRSRLSGLSVFLSVADRDAMLGDMDSGMDENFERLRRAEILATEKVVSVPQIALAFILEQPLDVYAVVASRSPDEFAANAAALDLSLTRAELDWLDLLANER